VFDDGDNGAREQCGLPNLPGYVVTPKARAAKLQVQAVPNPVYKANVGHYRAIAERLDPEGIQSFGIMTGALPTTKTVRDADVEAAQQVGFKVVYSVEYNPGGENDWRPFVEDMKAKGVRVLQFVGEPQFLTDIQKKMDEAGWHPEITIEDTNIYDTKYLEEAGSFAQDTYIRTSFTPFEMADQNKATQDYLDLMKQYNPSGKVAQLGAQGLSAWLLFAKAATECGADLTRTCLLQNAGAIKSWTGGGLHSAGDPSTNTPTDCVALVKVTPSAFQYDKQATDPNKGIFNCDPANLVELHNDYGVPR
jgi:ABC-type branched-subunit amino acid transport system substrate-binding protein